MAIHQCPYCELRFQSEAEYNDHLRVEHSVDPARLERFRYGAARDQKPLYPDLVEGVDQRRHQVLVLSNATLRAERLSDHLAEQARKLDTLYMLVVPAEETGRVLQHEKTFATTGRATPANQQSTSGAVLAQYRLNEALARFRGQGLAIEGVVGDPDPLRAIAEALPEFRADEIVLCTLPQGISGWLAADLPTKLRRRFGIPVTVVRAA